MSEQKRLCLNLGICGGCALGRMTYEEQLAAKEKEMKQLFEPVLGQDFFTDGRYEGMLESPRREAFRNKMEYSFGNAQKDGPLNVGLHRHGRFFDIIEIPDCAVVHPDMNTVVQAAQNYFRGKGIPFVHKKSHEGILRHLVLRRSETTGDLLVNLVTVSGWQPEADWQEMLLELPLCGRISGILHTENDSLSDAVIPQRVTLQWGSPYLQEEILGLRFSLSPFSFFQTNTSGAAVLYGKVREYVGGERDRTVFDLYSGTGTIAQLLAGTAREVIGVEIVEEAVEAARNNAAANGLTNCRFHAGDVLTCVDTLGTVPDVIVLDPPRDGVNPRALSKIMRFGAQRLIYVSCKPKSLVRDIPMLRLAGYEVTRLCLVDMFPFSANCEAVACLDHAEG